MPLRIHRAGIDVFRDDERGANMVEFALLAPIVFAVLLGIFTFGNAYFQKITITDAVREGTRFGATLENSASWADTVQARTNDLSDGELTDDQICVQLVEVGPGTPPSETPIVQALGTECDTEVAPPSTPEGVAAGDCLAKVWARKPAKIEAIIYARHIHLTAGSVAQYERECP